MIELKEKEQTTDKIAQAIPYPEIPKLPDSFIGFCPFLKYTPNGFPPNMPKGVRERVRLAVPFFGMSIRVFYPEKIRGICKWHNETLWGSKGDPLVIGECGNKFYLIAAWE